jgi:hypothetical protein
MKTTFYQSLLAAASTIGLVQAEPPAISSEPLGYTTATINGSYENGSRKNNIISPNLVNRATWQGSVGSISGDDLVLVGASLATGALNASSISPKRYSYYVNSSDGYWAHIVSNGSDRITLPAGFAANFTAGEALVIRRHLTIADYLGANEVGLKSSASGNFDQADRITIVDQENGGNLVVIASPAAGGVWVNDSLQDASGTPIYPDQAIQISRVSSGDLVLQTTGEVDTKGRQIRVTTGTNIRPISVPTSMTLAELLLHTGDAATGVASDSRGDISKADTVRVTTNGVTSIYFYSSADLGSGTGWYTESLEPAGDKVLPAGSAVVIKRSNPLNNSPFIWKSPAPTIQ